MNRGYYNIGKLAEGAVVLATLFPLIESLREAS